jgi:hypothetical protein
MQKADPYNWNRRVGVWRVPMHLVDEVGGFFDDAIRTVSVLATRDVITSHDREFFLRGDQFDVTELGNLVPHYRPYRSITPGGPAILWCREDNDLTR